LGVARDLADAGAELLDAGCDDSGLL
jgi:hypothetical protein